MPQQVAKLVRLDGANVDDIRFTHAQSSRVKRCRQQQARKRCGKFGSWIWSRKVGVALLESDIRAVESRVANIETCIHIDNQRIKSLDKQHNLLQTVVLLTTGTSSDHIRRLLRGKCIRALFLLTCYFQPISLNASTGGQYEALIFTSLDNGLAEVQMSEARHAM